MDNGTFLGKSQANFLLANNDGRTYNAGKRQERKNRQSSTLKN